MSDQNVLGGRLRLLDPQTLDNEQKHLYDRIATTMARWAERVGFSSQTSDGRVIGPFNPALYSPEIAEPFLELQLSEETKSSLNNRVRQVVILTVGAFWKAPYQLYAHSAAARAAGLACEEIEALTAGQAPDSLSEQERIAQRFTMHLARDHDLTDDLYGRAVRLFGERGLVDMIMLAGCYHTVCSLLNGFAIPAPDG